MAYRNLDIDYQKFHSKVRTISFCKDPIVSWRSMSAVPAAQRIASVEGQMLFMDLRDQVSMLVGSNVTEATQVSTIDQCVKRISMSLAKLPEAEKRVFSTFSERLIKSKNFFDSDSSIASGHRTGSIRGRMEQLNQEIASIGQNILAGVNQPEAPAKPEVPVFPPKDPTSLSSGASAALPQKPSANAATAALALSAPIGAAALHAYTPPLTDRFGKDMKVDSGAFDESDSDFSRLQSALRASVFAAPALQQNLTADFTAVNSMSFAIADHDAHQHQIEAVKGLIANGNLDGIEPMIEALGLSGIERAEMDLLLKNKRSAQHPSGAFGVTASAVPKQGDFPRVLKLADDALKACFDASDTEDNLRKMLLLLQSHVSDTAK